jgi:hypothetical protein
MSPSARGGHNINLSYTDPSISASLSGGSESSTPSRGRQTQSVIEEAFQSPYRHHHPPPEYHSTSLFLHEGTIPRPHSVTLSDPSGSSLATAANLSPPHTTPPFLNPNVLPLELKEKQISTETSSSDFRSPYSAANISPPYPSYSAYHEPHSPPPPPHTSSSSISSPVIPSSPETKVAEHSTVEDDSSTNNILMNPPWPWIQYTAEEGWPYYYNQVTGESSWEYPEQSLAGENIGEYENSSLQEHSSGFSINQSEDHQHQSQHWQPQSQSLSQSQSQSQQSHTYDISDDSDLSSCTSVDIKTETNSFFSHSVSAVSVSHQSAGMVIEQKNKQGQSVLHIAAASGNAESLSLLVPFSSPLPSLPSSDLTLPFPLPPTSSLPLPPTSSLPSSPQVWNRIF